MARALIRGKRRRVRVTWHGPERIARNFARLCELATTRQLLRGQFPGSRVQKGKAA